MHRNLSSAYLKRELEKEKLDLIVKLISEKQKIIRFIVNPDSEEGI